jgi:hypothetical protein
LNPAPLGGESRHQEGRHQEGKWCEFNDAKVMRLNDKEVNEQGAYLLFYRRVDYVDSIIEDELRTDYSEQLVDDIPPENENPYANH